MASHCPSSPGFQLCSSLLRQSQHEALTAACPNLRTAAFLRWKSSTANSNGGKNQACHPLLLHCWTRSWYLVVFLSRASSHLSSHGTVGSTMIIFPSPLGPNDYVWPHGCLDSGGNVVSFPGSASSSRIEWSAGGF